MFVGDKVKFYKTQEYGEIIKTKKECIVVKLLKKRGRRHERNIIECSRLDVMTVNS